ncbi:hypothetical protein LCGC14_2054090 [marine sediment metagenome]|uniref:Uncharacterized protein n=1 Tax=marine sediment metagenome TaxID=412755 RepID=A0A0F9EN29_9ZZZZ
MKTISKIRVPKADVLPGGAFRELAITSIIMGHGSFEVGDNVEFRADMSKVQPTFVDLVALVQSGGYFENIKLGIEFTNVTAALQNVPSIVQGYQLPDPDNEGQMLTHTWITWLRQYGGGKVLKEITGTKYVIKANRGEQLLNSDELKVIHAMIGIQVIEWSAVKACYNDSDNWETINI